jgi:hypothetical protein
MNRSQELWWEQSCSDLEIFKLLRRNNTLPCHQLHYLQIVAEKLAKAYFWRSGSPPPRSHAGAIQFFRALGTTPTKGQNRLAEALEFPNFNSLRTWIRNSYPLIYELEHLAPALARDGPNPEYPWPHSGPTTNPVRYQFSFWSRMNGTAIGRQLVKVLEIAVNRFPAYS